MSIPFHCPHGHVLYLDGAPITFVAPIGHEMMHFIDDAGEILLVDGVGGQRVVPDVAWALRMFRAGRLLDPDAASAMLAGRQARFLGLDRAACLAIDPLVGWKFDWADAAVAARLVRSEYPARTWIGTQHHLGEKPKWRSLLRWVKRLREGGGRIGALVSTCGRLKGQSQLSDMEDRLVHKWALLYWRPKSLFGYLAYKEDAAAMVAEEWDRLVAAGHVVPGPSGEAPSPEAVRERINGLECYSTYASRHGVQAADAKFVPCGEPVPVTRPFERIYMDGTEYEHSVHFADDHRVPAVKMKGVMAMDCFTSYVFPFPVFAGPYRPAYGLAALRNVMVAPAMSEEEVAADPEASMVYSVPSDVMIDRDRTLIPPRAIPGTIKIASTVELAEAYHHDAKAELENFHKFVKGRVRDLVKGQILSARSRHAPGYDPLKSTNVTRAQYIDLVEQCRREWNALAKASLGWRSPTDLMKEFVRRGETRITDPGEVRRALSSTPSKPCTLTPNGLVYDNVHYRWMRSDIASTLSLNAHSTPFAKRLEREAKVLVSIRTWDDDIDMIEVWDEERSTFVAMYSTEPEYTGRLSRWEHHQYRKVLRKGGGGATTRSGNLRTRATYLGERRKTLGDRPFREREHDVGLLEGEEKRLSGKRGENPDCARVPELHVPVEVSPDRDGPSKPPPQRDPDVDPGDDEEAADVRSDPVRCVDEEIGLDDLGEQAKAGRWDFDEEFDPYDAEDEED